MSSSPAGGFSRGIPEVVNARDRELLAQRNITHILSIHDTAAPILEDMTYLCISAADQSNQNLVAGVSRSVTLVVAYIMTATGRGCVESLAAVRAVRPCAGPNLGFLRQLKEFENTELTELLNREGAGRKQGEREGCNMQQSSAVRIRPWTLRIQICDTRCNRSATSGASACLASER
ncbi:Dual specificity protein phosphatase 22-B [Liparis tanakae]|uniref:Dual specificity protein phosphatase 22-B n=1 Tax=Liparis tanakae TaxID=230148 RepID=A0A4Z2IG43_9TELE|nr:Dual specificity protein phosphatase 22-B [Liparis tanakae]